ncbi:MAG TPA: hypothetical protein VGH54_29550 [Mycobacterium sp.]|uniref:hypothetical protein n=1 Tax=Mycobacterium sp. TaxID=1785 RepID=UPI002F4052A2
MTAFEHRYYVLNCNGDQHRCRAEFRGDLGETRAAVRKRAAKAGWTHVHPDRHPRSWDKDYCPEHKPAEANGG